MRKTKAFIVLGLGDDTPGYVKYLSLPGIETEVFKVGWRKPVQDPKMYFEARLSALLAKIDEAYAQSYKIILIGTSAGGSFVMNAFYERQEKVALVINCSGRLTQIEGVCFVSLEQYKQTDPVFMQSVIRSEKILAYPTALLKQKFLAFVPFYDELVPLRSMRFEGANYKRIWFVEHLVNIALVFTLYRGYLLKAIEKA